MKSWRAFILAAILSSTMMATAVMAAESEVATVAVNDTVSGDYFAASGTVTIDGKVTSDVYVAGGTVNINGTVAGDVIAAGGTVNVRGKVDGSVRAAGGDVIVGGEVGRNVTIAGGNLKLATSAVVRGNVIAAGSVIDIMGPVAGSVRLAGEEVTLRGSVGSETRVKADQLTIASTAKLSGPLTYTSPEIARIEAGSQVTGPVTRHLEPKEERRDAGWMAGFQIIWVILSALVMGLVIVAIVPGAMTASAAKLGHRPWASLGMGALIIFGGPIAIIMVIFTLVGIPLALVAGLVWLLAILIGPIVAALWFGQLVTGFTHWKLNAMMSYILGSLMLGLLYLIPVIGGLLALAACLLGVGAMLLVVADQKPAVPLAPPA